MKNLMRAVAVFAALCLLLVGGPAVSAGKTPDRVGDVRAGAMKVRIDGANGVDRYRAFTKKTKVFLVDRAGNRTRADLNELGRGAKVVGKRVVDGKIVSIALAEKGPTGSSDCSFDSSDDDGDAVTDDDSFECSNDYDDGTVDTDSDCSYDSSSDGPASDHSLDMSWDCSYSETDDRDEDEGGLDWDCSFSASADTSSDADGSDTSADLDFDCSWNGASTDSALWNCRFIPGSLGFECNSAQLQQTFGYTIDTDDLALDGGLDFQTDIVDENTGDDGVGCSGTAADGHDCSVDGEAGTGDCTVDWDFDRSGATREGDVSGSLSYSCSTEGSGSTNPDDL